MRIRLGFQRAADERFVVVCETLRGGFAGSQGTFTVVPFEDENDFLQQLVFAELPREDTVNVVAAVLLTMSDVNKRPDWVNLVLTQEQFLKLGLKLSSRPRQKNAAEEIVDLNGVLMQSPTPFVLMMGPEHKVVFGNAPYTELIRRSSVDSVLGKTIRDALPELRGQPFFALLDEVYRTGQEHVGHAIPIVLRNDSTGRIEQRYLDFIYCPVRTPSGEICGIMAQATDVTENVLERQVRDAREEQLYKQWAELDALYRYSPLALCLLDAKEFRILRMNDLGAELLGASADDLIGRVLPDLLPIGEKLRILYERVALGEVIHNEEVCVELPPNSGYERTWLVTCSPLFDEAGNVETIASVSLEITDRLALVAAGERRVAQKRKRAQVG